ncbi:serine hydrolase [Hymenobacter rigui]|uniref:T9SS C-terminal target domain-containing protein n=1 Tax=Hymenobacter rigui TaxID=334424 RepID=A0A428KLN2_9BACT|nr:serine hydrolase [Hymenobacter rigui]RSK47378.1 T9SS C-terminal target domain-containing protein [Hymenobacter rigui]
MKHSLRWLLLLLLLLPALPGRAQPTPLYFPPTPATAGSWATTSPQSLGWCQPQLDSLLNFLGRKGTKSFIVLKDGRIVVERYYGTFTQDSVWYWASAGKSLTATLTGLARQDGLLTLQDSVNRFLGRGWSSAPAGRERLITLRHLLTMTSGLDDTPPAPCDNESSTPGCLLYRTDAGTRWAYHTGAYRQLQTVLARASGLPLNQYTNQRLASRIGMQGLWVQDVYYSRARDMARFGLFALARGSWNGTAILTDTSYFRQMTTPSQNFNRSYGYLWWLNGQSSYMLPGPQQLVLPGNITPSAPADMVAALGKNDQKIYVVPSLRLVVVRQGASAGSPRLALSSFDTDLWRYLIAAMQCRPLATTAAATPAAFQVFPNPATSAVTVQLPAAAQGTVRLLNAHGQVIRQAHAATTILLPVAGLPGGLYLLQWVTPDGHTQGSRPLMVP